MTLRTLSAVLALLAGCGGPSLSARVEQPVRRDRDWVTSLQRGHPLVGRIWDAREKRWAGEAELRTALAAADFVFLGEVHDNPDHHVLQARFLRAVTESGRRPALAFEMLGAEQQPDVDAALARTPRDPDALAQAVKWDKTGWPAFKYYRPIFAVGLDAGLPVVAANLPRKQMRAVVKEGASALPERVRVWLDRAGSPSEAELKDLRQEMNDSHCGELPEPMMDPLILAQRARDASMAERMAATGDGRGAVLVTGNGHARKDRGAPAYIAREVPGKTVLTVAVQEVHSDATTPDAHAEAYGSDALPFDYVVFTPAAKREDPCAGLRERQAKLRAAEQPKP